MNSSDELAEAIYLGEFDDFEYEEILEAIQEYQRYWMSEALLDTGAG